MESRILRDSKATKCDSTRRAVTQFRKDIAELKRVVKAFERRLTALESEEKKRIKKPASTDLAKRARFSAEWVVAHLERIGFSQKDYAKLVGVSSLTIYNWESGKSRPRKTAGISGCCQETEKARS